MKYIIETFIFTTPVIIYLFGFFKFKARKKQIILWVSLILIMFSVGVISNFDNKWTEISLLGNGLLLSSSLWFIFPGFKLIEKFITENKFKNIMLVIGAFILPVISVLLCIALLFSTGNLWI